MKTIHQTFSVPYAYPVIFTRDAFAADNSSLPDLLPTAGGGERRLLVVLDSGVLAAAPGLPGAVDDFARRNRHLVTVVAPPAVMRGGEACKNGWRDVEMLHSLMQRHHICRHSFILAIGGGAVLDVAGFAAATAHRGVRLIRMPTTTLAQNDAGIGVKNGINAFGTKNYLGSFAPPHAVINDFDFLRTLDPRDMRAGMAEAVKVALIKDATFFEDLYRDRLSLGAFCPDAVERMIMRCAALHLDHISRGGDPFETGSSRPLDFGHWSAHPLEEATRGEVRHGEAVAIGIALDSLYSFRTGRITGTELDSIFAILEEIGFRLYHPALRHLNVEQSLQAFREHLGGELTIPVLEGIGRKMDVHRIDVAVMQSCIGSLAARANGKESPHGYQQLASVRSRHP